MARQIDLDHVCDGFQRLSEYMGGFAMVKRSAMLNAALARVVLILLVLTACNPNGGVNAESLATKHDNAEFKFAGNPDPNERIELPGFSVSTPRGENWIEGPRLPDPDPNDHGMQARLHFVKVLPQYPEFGPHTVFAQVGTVFLSEWDRRLASAGVREFMRFRMKYAMASDKVSVTPRQHLMSQQAKLDQSIGYTCYKYDAVLEDRGVKGFPNVAFVIDFHSYECIDPSLRMIVSLYYSQRVHPEAKPADLRREGEQFLKSLKFTSPISKLKHQSF